MKKLALASVLSLALASAACTTTGSLTPTAQNDVTTALGVACPVLATLAGQKLTALQNGAYNTLSIACPPNAPPTNAVTVASDLLAAYAILSPLVK